MAWPVAELQADPEFQALPPAVQERVMAKLLPAGAEQYKGAPDQPLENTDFGGLSNKGVGNIARAGVPIAAALAGPAGLAAGMGVAGAAGAGGSVLGDMVEGNPVSGGKALASGALNMASVPASRVLGALVGTSAAKLGLKNPGAGSMDLADTANVAGDITQNVARGTTPKVADKILEILGRTGNKLPIKAEGMKPSVEMIRQQIPYREPAGKALYSTLRESAKGQAPEYDKLLQQFRATHALTDIPSLKEVLATGVLGGGAVLGQGWPGLLAMLLPRLAKSASYAPKAPGIQAGMSGLSSALTQSME